MVVPQNEAKSHNSESALEMRLNVRQYGNRYTAQTGYQLGTVQTAVQLVS